VLVQAGAVPPRPYRFHAAWRLPGAAPATVFDVLADPAGYVAWWPQVRRCEELGGPGDPAAIAGAPAPRRARLVCRSFLPYSLRFVVVAEHDDPGVGVLQAQVRGDLDGWIRWTVTADDEPGHRGTLVVLDQHVRTPAPLLRHLGRLARPALVWNHAWMLRSGRRGLLRHLEGGRSLTG
jgi:uncharacterized protein YndB with AHSA1/START domain